MYSPYGSCERKADGTLASTMAIDPELKQELEALRALTRDNHRMLRALRRDQWLGFIGRLIIWLVVLAVPFYLYQRYLEPMYSALVPGQATTTTGFLGLPSSAQLRNLIHSTQGK